MKAPKPINHAPARTLSKAEKEAMIMKFLQQKREQFAINILNGLCSNPGSLAEKVVVKPGSGEITEPSVSERVVNLAVDMADKLLEKLYPLPEEESK